MGGGASFFLLGVPGGGVLGRVSMYIAASVFSLRVAGSGWVAFAPGPAMKQAGLPVFRWTSQPDWTVTGALTCASPRRDRQVRSAHVSPLLPDAAVKRHAKSSLSAVGDRAFAAHRTLRPLCGLQPRASFVVAGVEAGIKALPESQAANEPATQHRRDA